MKTKSQEQQTPSIDEYKIALIGSGAVGKSNITIQYIQNLFLPDYDATIEDNFRKHDKIDGQPVFLDIFDTAGQEEFKSLRDGYMRNCDGFIAVYDISNKHSVKELVEDFLDHLMRVKDSDSFPLVLAGNKADLESEREVNTMFVRRELQKLMPNRYQDIPIQECSAKKRTNIDELFFTLVREMRKKKEVISNQINRATKKKNACSIL